MLFAIMSTDVENSLEKRLSVRPAHVARLDLLQAEGRLVLAGPHPAIESDDPGPAGFSGPGLGRRRPLRGCRRLFPGAGQALQASAALSPALTIRPIRTPFDSRCT
jgi:hypothetical protein